MSRFILIILNTFFFATTCISQVNIFNSTSFERHENILIGPSNVTGYYPNQALDYINKYTIQKDSLWEYLADIQQEIDMIESKWIKNPKKLKRLKLRLKKSQLGIEMLSEIINIWKSEQLKYSNFYSMFNVENAIDLNCYKFIIQEDTLYGNNLELIVNNSDYSRYYYEIINGKISQVTGKLSEKDEINYNQVLNGKSFNSFMRINMNIVDYEITEVELDSIIYQYRNYGYKISRRQLMELDDIELIERIEKHFPSYTFDNEAFEMYKEVHYQTENDFIQLYENETGLQIIPDKWIKIKCE